MVFIELLIVISISLLVIFLPFWDSGNLYRSYLTESALFFIVFVSLIATVYLIYFFLSNRKSFQLKIYLCDILLILFLSYVFFNRILISDLHGVTLKGLRLISLILFYVLLRSLQIKYLKLLFYSLLISGIAQAVYGNLQLWGFYPSNHNLFNITGSFFNPGPYAGYLSMILPIALTIFLNNSNPKQKILSRPVYHRQWLWPSITKTPTKLDTLPNNMKQPETTLKQPETTLNQHETTLNQHETTIIKYLSITTIIVILLVLPATRSRAAWLSTLAGSVFVLNHYYPFRTLPGKYFNTPWRKWLLYISFLFLGIGLSTGIYLMKKGSADGRLLIWKVSSKLIAERPIFGYGVEKFQAHYMEIQAEYFRENPQSDEAFVADDIIYPFNEFIKALTELGFVGLTLAILPIFGIFFFSNRNGSLNKKRGIHAGAKGGIISFLVFSLFSYPTEILPVILTLTVLISISSGSTDNQYGNTFLVFRFTGFGLNLIRLSFMITIIFLLVFLYYPVKNLYSAYYYWDEGYKIYQMGAYENSIESFEKASPLLMNNGEFLIMYGKALSMAGRDTLAIEKLQRAMKYQKNTILYNALGDSYKKLNQYVEAEQAYLKAHYMIPSRFYSRYLLAKLYMDKGETEKAIIMAKEILTMKEKIPSTAVEEIKQEMKTILDMHHL